MKKITLLLSIIILLIACKKETKTNPQSTSTGKDVTYHATSTTMNTAWWIKINGVDVADKSGSYPLHSGDKIEINAKSQKSTILNSDGSIAGYSQEHVKCVLYIDGQVQQNAECNCDVNISYTNPK